MNTLYRGYTIITEIRKTPNGYWTATLGIVAPGGLDIVDLNLAANMLFSTELIAEQAAVTLARYWIDEQKEKSAG